MAARASTTATTRLRSTRKRRKSVRWRRPMSLSLVQIQSQRLPRQVVQLIAESRAEQKAAEHRDTIQSAIKAHDHHGAIIEQWRCQEQHCRNAGGVCFVPMGVLGPPIHYKVNHVDLESWAHNMLQSTPEVNKYLPPRSLVQYWREAGNQLAAIQAARGVLEVLPCKPVTPTLYDRCP
ncbi:hypothetical protein K469DRAFT_717734 [Zopfia rhizophila CBS 207.26]|uniref:Uncharacterized protein n=1 Tax=Zopfia rhizophila CBS 207.26 TaxID=1314779 RepID=A0A6A6DIJ7_9PEZI|nr:hypothetical protein K469DRAFT_717734 [Zopfia rhizophila CBS 207.26]